MLGKARAKVTGLSLVCRRGKVFRLFMSLLARCFFIAAVPGPVAADQPVAALAAPQAQVNPEVIRLPVVDGDDIRFTHVSTAQGLSQTRVPSAVKDDQGFMWFGTQYGLNRYDGNSFRLFAHDPRNPNSFSGVYITALFKDPDGRLWIGCEQFLERFEPRTETFTRYPIRGVSHISQDSAGPLWLATGTGLWSLDPVTGRTRQYSHDPNDALSLSSSEVKSSGEDRQGRFWAVNSEGLDEFDRKTGRVNLHVPLREPLPEFSFYEDHTGVLWIIYPSDNGLAVFDRKTNTLTRYSIFDPKQPGNVLTGVMAVLEDRNGTLWFGTRGSDLLKFDRERQTFIRYRNSPADSKSLPENYILSLCEDQEGGIWVGFESQGLAHFDPRGPAFTRLDPAPSGGTRLVNGVFEDDEGIVWLATREALHRIDRKAASSETSPPDAVISIREDASGDLWLGTFNQGLHRFDRRTGRYNTYRHNPADPSSLSNDVVTRLLIDHNGTLWAATFDGLNRFDAATERFTTYTSDPQNKKLYYLELAEDQKGYLWLGGFFSGLQRFDPATGVFTTYEHDLNRPGTLSDNRVNSIHFDRSNTMWVGTQNGLNKKFNPITKAFDVYTQRDGLPGNVVSCILEDELGNLWMSTNNGIAKLNPQTNLFLSYTATDGLPDLDLSGWGICSKSSSGEMFFAGFAGAVSFFPAKVAGAQYIPPIVITDFRLKGNPVDIGGNSFLHNSISYVKELVLFHDQNTFSFTLSALSFSDPATNRYRYKLDGLDRDWNEVGNDRREATYTTLPPGNYTFRAQGATSRGAWSEPGVASNIEILPPWWGTWWFRIICAALILAAIWLLHRSRIRNIAQREHEFRKLAENLPDMVMRFGRDLRCSYANPTTEECTGKRAKQFLGKSSQEAELFSGDVQTWEAALRQVFSTSRATTKEFTCRTAKGERDFDSRFVPEVEGAGSTKSVLAITRDITERKRADAALRDSEEQWKAVFENNPTMYFMLDASDTILLVNPYGAAQLGYAPEDLTGRPAGILIHEADREFALRNKTGCLEHLGQTMSWEVRKLRKDGSVIQARETARAMLIKNRPVVLLVSEDITEAKRAAEALRETQIELAHANRLETMGHLTASIAHEVNQPISASATNALAGLRWLRAAPPNLDEARQAFDRIVKDSIRAADVVQRVRNLTKKAPSPRDRLEINAVVREVIEFTRSETTKNDVFVRTELSEGLPPVHGDRVELQQVILNLILNAIDAMSGGEATRELAIATGKADLGDVLVSVSDSGPGIAPEHQENLFTAFRTTKPNGLGLGLSICRSIVESHGGRIWASSNAPRGAVFQFTLSSNVDDEPPERSRREEADAKL